MKVASKALNLAVRWAAVMVEYSVSMMVVNLAAYLEPHLAENLGTNLAVSLGFYLVVARAALWAEY